MQVRRWDPARSLRGVAVSDLVAEMQVRRIERHLLLSHGGAMGDDQRVSSGIIVVMRNDLRWIDAAAQRWAAQDGP